MRNDEWLVAVWSMIVLNQYNGTFIDSVLNPDFIQGLNIRNGTKGIFCYSFSVYLIDFLKSHASFITPSVDIALKLKLQNINGYAKLRGVNYKGIESSQGVMDEYPDEKN